MKKYSIAELNKLSRDELRKRLPDLICYRGCTDMVNDGDKSLYEFIRETKNLDLMYYNQIARFFDRLDRLTDMVTYAYSEEGRRLDRKRVDLIAHYLASTQLNYSQIGRKLKIPEETLQNYLSPKLRKRHNESAYRKSKISILDFWTMEEILEGKAVSENELVARGLRGSILEGQFVDLLAVNVITPVSKKAYMVNVDSPYFEVISGLH